MLSISTSIFTTPFKFVRSAFTNPLNFLKFPLISSVNKTGIEKLIELFESLIIHFSKAKVWLQKKRNKKKYLINQIFHTTYGLVSYLLKYNDEKDLLKHAMIKQ